MSKDLKVLKIEGIIICYIWKLFKITKKEGLYYEKNFYPAAFLLYVGGTFFDNYSYFCITDGC